MCRYRVASDMETKRSGTIEDPGTQSNIRPGWRARLCFDEDDTGGWYLFFSDPDDANVGFDDWFLEEDDAYHNIRAWRMKIRWD